MKLTKRIASLCAVLLCLAAAPAARAEQQPLTIKLATLAPEGTIFYDSLLKMANEWTRLSGGKVKVKIYAGGIAGSEDDMVRKIRIGQLHAATLSAIGMMQIDASYTALQLPGMMSTYEELDYVRRQLAPQIEKRFADKGFVVANYCDLGHMYFFTAKKTGSIAELQKKKICTFAGDQASKEIWAKAGFNAVDVPMSEMMTALQTGLIDGFMDTPVFALSLQIFAKAPNMINVSYGIAIGATIVQKSVWNKIESDLQKAFIKASQDLVAQSQAEVRSMDEKAIAEMKKYGLQTTEVAPQDVKSWLDPLQKIYPEIREKLIPKDIFDTTIELRNQYRAGKK
ncbi:MAG: TRAP transporter substrate-binding protein DctP [Deltaproteobacteria bacterium]|nr:TRAP transporter substrate-binding protein DctP [Deltaproteobacteria bacterium]